MNLEHNHFLWHSLHMNFSSGHHVFTIKKHGFSKGQFDWNVHIDPRVCPFWLKVWGMKNTCYIWLKWPFKPNVKSKVWSKWTNVHQNDHGLVKLAILNGHGLIKLIILIWPLVKLTIMTFSQMNHIHSITKPTC